MWAVRALDARALGPIRSLMKLALFGSTLLVACTGAATARLQLANQTPVAHEITPTPASSLRIKLISVYLAEDVDPATMDNVGQVAMIWLNPECDGDTDGCNVDGMTAPVGGPRITGYFDFAQSTADVDAELGSQDAQIEPGSYRYARVDLCKALDGQAEATVPTLMWAGPGMTAEQPFTSGDCGRTSLPFASALELAAGDSVAVTLGYDLSAALVAGMPGPGSYDIAGDDDADGSPHSFRACADLDATHRDCMDYPDFVPSASRQ